MTFVLSFLPLYSEVLLTKQKANTSYCYNVPLELKATLMFPLSNFGFQDNAPLCQLFEICVLFCNAKMLSVGGLVTRGRWLWFDNGVDVSLGNRRDLTQDVELPLGFFYAPSPMCLPCLPAFLPSRCPFTEGKDGSSVPAESEMKSWDTTVISVLMTWELWTAQVFYIQYHAPGQRKITLIGCYNHFPSTHTILQWHTGQINHGV